MAYRGIGSWVAAPWRLVGPEPAFKDAAKDKMSKTSTKNLMNWLIIVSVILQLDEFEHSALINDAALVYLSMKAWCSRNIGSLAEPWTEDIEPFMKTCRELCMVLWPGTARPVSGLANPAGGDTD